MRREILVLGMLLTFVISYSLGVDVYLVDDNGNRYLYKYFDTTGTYSYADISDVRGIEICGGDFSGKWIALAYAQNSTTLNYYAVSRNGSSGNSAGVMVPLVQKPDGCYGSSTTADFVIMGAEITSNIPLETSAYPARVWAIISDNPDLSGNVIFIPTNITFLGNYQFNDYKYTYNPNTGNITVELSNVLVNNGNGDISIKNDQYWAYKSFFLGTCEDQYGQRCYQSIKGTGSFFESAPIEFYTGHKNVDDQHPHNMYLVANGIGYPLDLGADLVVNNINVPTTIYYGEKFKVNVTIENVGNVNVTHNFNITLTFHENINSVKDVNYTILYNVSKYGIIGPKESKTLSFIVSAIPNGNDAFNHADEVYTIATVDSSDDIKETNEQNNAREVTFVYKSVYVPNVIIQYNHTSYSCNGTPCFPYPGRIYNVTFSFISAPDNVIVNNFNFEIVKEGGVNTFVPLRVGVDNITEMVSVVSVNMSGNSISIPMIPSKTNNFDEDIYIWSPGNKFYNGTDVVDKYYLKINTTNYENVTAPTEWKNSSYKDIIYGVYGVSSYLGRIYELLYEAFGFS